MPYTIEAKMSDAMKQSIARSIQPDSFTQMEDAWKNHLEGREYASTRVINVPFRDDTPIDPTLTEEQKQAEKLKLIKELYALDLDKLQELADLAKA